MTNHPLIDLTDRIGGWPEPEVETCDWCGRETPPHDRRYVDRHVTWWVCVDCYRATRRAPVPASAGTSQNKGGLA